MSKLRTWLLAGLATVLLAYSCVNTEIGVPMKGHVVTILPETEIHFCGPGGCPDNLYSPRAGLFWTDGTTNRIYVYGVRFKDGKIYAQSEQVVGHEVMNTLRFHNRNLIYDTYNEDGTPKGDR